MNIYSCGAANNTPAANTTDFFTITGLAGGIIQIRRILLSAVSTTAGHMTPLLIRRSSADLSGTSTAPTEMKHDPTGPASGATLALYTANPTLGTTVATGRAQRLSFQLNTTTVQPVEWDFTDNPIKLAGSADILAVNFAGAAVPAGGAIDIEIEYGRFFL